MRRSEARFRTALRDSPICVYQTDRDLRYTWLYNPLFDGVSVARAIGRTDIDIRGKDAGRELHEFKQRVLSSEAGASTEIVVPFTSGARSLLINAEPLRDEYDRVVGLTAAMFGNVVLGFACAAALAAFARTARPVVVAEPA